MIKIWYVRVAVDLQVVAVSKMLFFIVMEVLEMKQWYNLPLSQMVMTVGEWRSHGCVGLIDLGRIRSRNIGCTSGTIRVLGGVLL